MKVNIAAVVVLYNPDKKFINNLYTYIDHVSLLIVVDNSEKPDPSFYQSFQNDARVKLMINNKNNGIAKAVNDAVKFASEHNYEWILTMDQDSFFKEEMIKKYIDSFNEIQEKDSIAVTGPVTEDQPIAAEVKNVTQLITSGSLVNIKAFIKTGWYNEKLFIDEVDHDFCYRAKLNGFRLLQFQGIKMEHSIGDHSQVTTLSGKTKLKSFHSPIRLYYIVRNCCFIISEYKASFPVEIKARRRDLLVRIKNNVLYGPKRLAAIKYIILGFIHYTKGRFGKL